MAYGSRVTWDTIRELPFGSLSDTYAAIGVGLTKAGRIVKITNNTNETLYISDDGVNDKLKLPENSFELWDITTNKALEDKPQFLEVGKIFYARHITAVAPTSGWVSIEVLTVETGS